MITLKQALFMQQVTGPCLGPVEETLSGWGQHSNHLPAAQQPTIDKLADLIVSSFAQSQCAPFRSTSFVGHADKDWQGAKLEDSVSFNRAKTVETALTLAVKKLWADRSMGPPPVGGVEWTVRGEGSRKMIAPPYHDANRRVVVTLSRSGTIIPPKPSPTIFTPRPMPPHNHAPSGKWSQVQANPNSPGASFLLIAACKTMSPQEFVRTAVLEEFLDKPIALQHLHWYLRNGKGADFVEDEIIRLMLEQDAGVRERIAVKIPRNVSGGKLAKHFKLQQADYVSQDFRFAFGAIDWLDFEVDFDARTVHVWFQDRYEWHPCYPGLYSKFEDDVPRETNCVHAALVELKASGAADFWMKGEATVPLDLILKK